MGQAPSLSTTAKKEPVSFMIRVADQELPPTYMVLSIVVTLAVNRVPTAVLTLVDGDPDAEGFVVSDSPYFLPGKQLEVRAGHGNSTARIFRGIVTRHGLRIEASRAPLLVVECKDVAVKMTVERGSSHYNDETDAKLIEAIVKSHGLTAEVQDTGPQRPNMVKFQATDWDFIVERAEANGKLVLVDDGKVTVKAPDTQREPSVELAFPDTIQEFEVELEARGQFNSIGAKAWDSATQQVLEQAADAPKEFRTPGDVTAKELASAVGPARVTLAHGGDVPAPELEAWAQGRMLRSRMAGIQGRVRCDGLEAIRPGEIARLEGIGKKFNGLVFITSVRHEIAQGRWETDLGFGLKDEWFSEGRDRSARAAGGLVSGIRGLQIGVVTQFEGDPEGAGRVRVRMPILDPAHDGLWARLACPDAGDMRGVYFWPEAGDEVVVGFLDGDPRQAIVLGRLNNKRNPSPLPAAHSNPLKGIVTRSRLKLVFNDEKRSISLETPGGRALVLSDEGGAVTLKDDNGNELSMTREGISLNSGAKVSIKATGELECESGGDASLKASGNLKCEGRSVGLSASTQLKAQGGASAELASSGMTQVRGAMVKIEDGSR